MTFPGSARWLLILTNALVVCGCTPEPARWSDIQSPKENKVQFTTLSHTVYFAPGAATLSKDQVRAFEQFAASAIHAGDKVAVEISAPDRSSPRTLAARRESEITRLLRKDSAEAVFNVEQFENYGQTRNAATIEVGRYVVTPPRCPDWTKPDSDDFTNTPSSNFGCAVMTDIGLMVADPADLVRGAGSGGADGAFAARGVELYRTGALSKTLSDSSGGSSGGAGGGGGGGGAGGASGGGGGN